MGISAGITSIFLPAMTNVMEIGLFWWRYPGFVILFFSGALASRNEWMESIKNMSRIVIYVWAFATYAIFMVGFYFSAGNNEELFQTLWATFISLFVMGIQCIPWVLCTTVFFMDFVNNKYFCTAFFTKAMYTAYLIHADVIDLVALIWAKITDATGFNPWSEGGWIVTFLFYHIVDIINYLASLLWDCFYSWILQCLVGTVCFVYKIT